MSARNRRVINIFGDAFVLLLCLLVAVLSVKGLVSCGCDQISSLCLFVGLSVCLWCGWTLFDCGMILVVLTMSQCGYRLRWTNDQHWSRHNEDSKPFAGESCLKVLFAWVEWNGMFFGLARASANYCIHRKSLGLKRIGSLGRKACDLFKRMP